MLHKSAAFLILAAVASVLFAGYDGVHAQLVQQKKEKSPDLPGAKGPLFVKAGNLKGGVEAILADVAAYLSVDVADKANRTKVDLEQQAKSRTLPRKAKAVVVYVKFRGNPDFKNLKIEIQGPDGPVELDKLGYADANVFDTKTAISVSTFNCVPKTGVFAAGAYQAKIKSSGQDAVIVNWEMRDPSK